MRFPTIHLNGTSPVSLADDISIAREKIDETIEAMAKASPNARDYYVQGPGAFDQADDEHMERMKKLHSIKEDLVDPSVSESVYRAIKEVRSGGHKMFRSIKAMCRANGVK